MSNNNETNDINLINDINKINEIKKLIGTDVKIVEEIGKYCEYITKKNKIRNMKSYVLKKIDKTYDMSIIDKYLDDITNLKHHVIDNSKDCHHEIKILSKFKINGVFVDFKCNCIEDDCHSFVLKIDKKNIIIDEYYSDDYCMIKKDDNKTNFNLLYYYRLDYMTQICSHYGVVKEETEEYIDMNLNEKDNIEYNEEKQYEKGVIDLKLFVDVCKNKFPDTNPVHMFDTIMLCLIYCYSL